MPQLIAQPTVVQAAGNKPKHIREYVGRVNTGTAGVSIAHMSSPAMRLKTHSDTATPVTMSTRAKTAPCRWALPPTNEWHTSRLPSTASIRSSNRLAAG